MNSKLKTASAPPIAATAEINTDTICTTQINRGIVNAIALAAAPTSNCSRPKHPPIHGSE